MEEGLAVVPLHRRPQAGGVNFPDIVLDFIAETAGYYALPSL